MRLLRAAGVHHHLGNLSIMRTSLSALPLAAAVQAALLFNTAARAAESPVPVGPPVVVTTTRFAEAAVPSPGITVITAEDIRIA